MLVTIQEKVPRSSIERLLKMALDLKTREQPQKGRKAEEVELIQDDQ